LSIFFFLLSSSSSFFRACSQPSHIRCLSYFHTCELSANLECRSELHCTRRAENTRRKKSPKFRHLGTIAQLCQAVSSQRRHVSTIKQEGQHPLTGQFQAVFPVITGSFPTNVIAHLHSLSMDLTDEQSVQLLIRQLIELFVGLTVKLCKHWFDSRSNY